MARSEKAIATDIADTYARLSPENLSCDGERDPKDAAREERELQKKLKALFTELGREIGEMEAYSITEP